MKSNERTPRNPGNIKVSTEPGRVQSGSARPHDVLLSGSAIVRTRLFGDVDPLPLPDGGRDNRDRNEKSGVCEVSEELRDVEVADQPREADLAIAPRV